MPLITLDFPSSDLDRFRTTTGIRLGLPGQANATQCKQRLIRLVIEDVQLTEQEIAAAAARAGVSAIAPT